MRRPVFRKSTTGMSLFPFLAVLICTMGALIVLLVMVLQQARVHASNEPAVAATVESPTTTQPLPTLNADEAKKLREAKEDADWQRDILQQQRSDQAQELSKARLELSHLEDHIRRLQEQWKLIEGQIAELKKLGESGSQDAASLQAQLEKVRSQLAASQREFDAAKQQTSVAPRSFAIIPYQGPNGTKRRPIYIECAEEGITLHPENIMFQAADFQGPMGPGNPLDAALRTIREYLVKTSNLKQDGEPYPLLIVRPTGAVAYAAARAAMKSWDDEFGYELIDAEMQLKFPPSDPNLEQLLLQTIKDARSRQIALAAAMPARYKDEGSVGFVANPRGGFSTMLDDGESSTSLQSAGGRGFASGSAASGAGTSAGGSGTGRDSRFSQGFASKPNAANSGSQTSASPGSNASGSNPGSGKNATKASGTANGYGQSATSAGTNGPGGSSAAGGSNASAGGPSATATANGSSAGGSPKAMESLARTKGADWALPNKAAHATGITRPIRVQCYPDRLVILSERGEQQRPRIYSFKDGAVRGTAEEFVTGIWKHMETWGLAVAGGYWKPALRVEVAPGAEQQFAELEAVLLGSGLDVVRK